MNINPIKPEYAFFERRGDLPEEPIQATIYHFTHTIRRINNRLEKINDSPIRKSTMLTHQEKNISALMDQLRDFDSAMAIDKSLPFEEIENVQKIGRDISHTFNKIASLRAELLPETETSEMPAETLDPGYYELVKCETLEHGKKYTFLCKDLTSKEDKDLFEKIHPAIVYPFDTFSALKRESIEQNKNNLGETLSSLGYSCDWDTGVITFPDCELLNYLSQKLVSESPNPKTHPLRGFEVQSSEGIAEDLEFIDAMLEGKTILSSGVEFTHDHLIHIMKEIELRLEGDFEKYRELIISMARPVRQFIDSASEVLQDLPGGFMNDELETDIKQLATLTSTFLDISSAVPHHWIGLYHSWFQDVLKADFKDSPIAKPFVKRFNKTYPESPLTEARLNYLLMLVAIIQTVNQDKFPELFRTNGLAKRLDQIMSKYIKDLEKFGIEIVPDREKGFVLKHNEKTLTIQDNPIVIMKLLRDKVGPHVF